MGLENTKSRILKYIGSESWATLRELSGELQESIGKVTEAIGELAEEEKVKSRQLACGQIIWELKK